MRRQPESNNGSHRPPVANCGTAGQGLPCPGYFPRLESDQNLDRRPVECSTPILNRADTVNESDSILAKLVQVIRDRKNNPPPRSYTTSLFEGGVDKIGGKVTEEARELVEAARETGEEGTQHFIHEAADLLYHMLVLLRHREVEWEAVEAELARRFGISGLDEKAARNQ